jgi:hypothetical protein
MGFIDWIKESLFGKIKEEEQEKGKEGVMGKARGYYSLENWLAAKIKPSSSEEEIVKQLKALQKSLSKKDKKMAKALNEYIRKKAYLESPFLLK